MDDAKLAENDRDAHTIRRRWARGGAVAGIGALIVAFACGDPYRHLNPYDPVVPVTFEITGPDSLFALGDSAQYSATTAPGFADTSFVWLSGLVTYPRNTMGLVDTVIDGATVFRPASGIGAYITQMIPLEPDVAIATVAAGLGQYDTTVTTPCSVAQCTAKHANFYRHVGYKSVFLSQRLVSIHLRCVGTTTCDTLAAGGTWSVWVDGLDANSRPPSALSLQSSNLHGGKPAVATYIVRDTSVASVVPDGIRAATVTALKAGTTWIVGTHLALRDSLKLVVQ